VPDVLTWHDITLTIEKKIMKNAPLYFLLALAITFLPGCGVVETIFKAGMWWAFILIFLFIGVIVWLVTKAKK
jgi:positive regulator of sigma E activity